MTFKIGRLLVGVFPKGRILKGRFPWDSSSELGIHYQNKKMTELITLLGFKQDHSSSFYLQENGKVEVINKTLKTILKQTINASRSNYHIMLYPALWAY